MGGFQFCITGEQRGLAWWIRSNEERKEKIQDDGALHGEGEDWFRKRLGQWWCPPEFCFGYVNRERWRCWAFVNLHVWICSSIQLYVWALSVYRWVLLKDTPLQEEDCHGVETMIESTRMKITELMTTSFNLSAQLPAFMSVSEGGRASRVRVIRRAWLSYPRLSQRLLCA